MRITMTSTDEGALINDSVPCRVWHGVTEAGVKVRVFVVGMLVSDDADTSEFDAELRELPVTIVAPRN